MEEVKVDILSREAIKPSNPTPPNLRHLPLSLPDQLAPWVYSPTVFFYPSSDDPSKVIATLKDALSRTLTLFYPVAGRFTADESANECNDEGVPFAVAQANCTLSDLLGSPNKSDQLKHFLPVNDTIALGRDPKESAHLPRDEIVGKLVSCAFQVTTFECGGLAVGVFGLHKLQDGCSVYVMLKTWAALAAGRDEEAMTPDFKTVGKMFPGIESEKVPKAPVPLTMWPVENGECLIRPFVFTPEKIAALRAQAMSESVPKPTRIEAVTAFVWKHAMAAAQTVACTKNGGLTGPSVLIHSVNIRPHMNIPLTVAGNLVMHGYTYYDGPRDDTVELSELVPQIRSAIVEARHPDLLKLLQGETGNETLLQSRKYVGGLISDPKLNRYRFTSWGRFDLDFGFGKPVWTGVIGGRLSSVFRNVVLLLDRVDNGLEAWAVLFEEDMEVLEKDLEFLKFATPNYGGGVKSMMSINGHLNGSVVHVERNSQVQLSCVGF